MCHHDEVCVIGDFYKCENDKCPTNKKDDAWDEMRQESDELKASTGISLLDLSEKWVRLFDKRTQEFKDES